LPSPRSSFSVVLQSCSPSTTCEYTCSNGIIPTRAPLPPRTGSAQPHFARLLWSRFESQALDATSRRPAVGGHSAGAQSRDTSLRCIVDSDRHDSRASDEWFGWNGCEDRSHDNAEGCRAIGSKGLENCADRLYSSHIILGVYLIIFGAGKSYNMILNELCELTRS
jgi:hypothetical protein